MIFGQIQMFWSYQQKRDKPRISEHEHGGGQWQMRKIGAIWIAAATRSLLFVKRDGFMANVPCALSFHSVHDTM